MTSIEFGPAVAALLDLKVIALLAQAIDIGSTRGGSRIWEGGGDSPPPFFSSPFFRPSPPSKKGGPGVSPPENF